MAQISQPPIQQGGLVVISAPAGTGKTTLVRKLLAECKPLSQAVSCTTRQPRPGEQEGVDYFFTTKERFQADVMAGQFVEWVYLFGDYYGTLISQIEQLQSSGKHVILVIDVNGALEFKRRRTCLTVFIAPPSLSALKSRLTKRGTETQGILEDRFQRASFEMKKSPLFDHTIVNDEFEGAYIRLLGVLQRELQAISGIPLIRIGQQKRP